MSLRLTFVAHAATAATRQAAFPADEPLEPLGARKAAALAEALGRVDAAWTSPALRAVQTAVALGLDATADAALADIDMPRWAGRSLAEIQASDAAGLSRWMTDPAASPHGGESVTDLLGRVESWLDSMRHHDGRVLAVTHPSVIRAAVIVALDADPGSFWRVDVEPLYLATFLGRSRRWTLRGLHPGDPSAP